MNNQNLLDQLKTIYCFSVRECKWKEFALKSRIPITRNIIKLILFFTAFVYMFSEKFFQNFSVIAITYSLMLLVTKKETVGLMKIFSIIVAFGTPLCRIFIVGKETILYNYICSTYIPVSILVFSGSYLLTTSSYVFVLILERYLNHYIMQEYLHSPQNFERMFHYYMEHSYIGHVVAWAFLSLIFYNKQVLLAQLWYKRNEMEELNKQAQKKNEELQSAKQSKNKFFLSLSHEFRNPINAALGNLELASERLFDAPAQKYIDNASTSIGLLLHLVSNLLDTHKIEAGSLEWNPILQESRKLFNKVWRISKNLLDKYDLLGEFYIHKKIPKLINTDCHYMIQTVLNVILNAIKYTQQGGIMIVISWLEQSEISEDTLKPTEAFYSKFLNFMNQNSKFSSSSRNNSLSLSTQSRSQSEDSFNFPTECDIPKEYTTEFEQFMMKDKLLKRSSVESIEEFRNIGKHYDMLTNRFEETTEIDWSYEKTNCYGNGLLKIEVFDSGRGIDDHLKNAIFQKYSSICLEGEDRLGLGLGLFLTKSMCELRGGRVKAFSEKDKGSQFVILLPIEEIVTACCEKATKLKNIYSESSLPQLSAFVVDDDKYNREISSVFLSKVGAQVKGEAVNGQEAVDVITSKPSGYCDFVLMDLEMPVMNGKEAVKRIRQYEALHQRVPTKVVIATGNVDLEEYTACMDPDGEIKADLFYRKPLKKKDFQEIAEIMQREKLQLSTCIVINGDNLMIETIQNSLKKHKVHTFAIDSIEKAESYIKQYQTNLRLVLIQLNQPQEKIVYLLKIISTLPVKLKPEVIGFSDNLDHQQKPIYETLGIEKIVTTPLNPDEIDSVFSLL